MNPFEGVQWSRFGEALKDLWAAPSSNLGASLLFVAAVGIVLLIFVVIGIVAIYMVSVDDDEEDDSDEDYEDDGGEGPAVSASDASDVSPDAVQTDKKTTSSSPRWARAVVWLVCVVVMLVAFDYLVGGTDVCMSCHVEAPHAREKSDPHVAVKCVRCHEDRRGLAAFSSSSARGLHVLSAAVRPAWSGGYGAVTASACRSCHKKQVDETLIIKAQELRISHKEPLEGGAICTDCHLLNDDGEIAERNRGMTTCLRCHDGKRAENECTECHLGDTSAAIRDDEKDMVFSATILVPDYRCGGCHTDQSECDECHGLRMPHTQAFEKRAHAKYAAFAKKASCVKECHSLSECNACHNFNPGQTVSGHAPDWTRTHGAGRSRTSACACHSLKGKPAEPFCPLCHDWK